MDSSQLCLQDTTGAPERQEKQEVIFGGFFFFMRFYDFLCLWSSYRGEGKAEWFAIQYILHSYFGEEKKGRKWHFDDFFSSSSILKMQQMPFRNVQGYFSKVTSIYFPASPTLAVSVSQDRIQFPAGQVGSNDNVLSWRWKPSIFTAPTHTHTNSFMERYMTQSCGLTLLYSFLSETHGIVLTHVHHGAAICKPLAVRFAGVLWSRARASRRIQQHPLAQSSWGEASKRKRGRKLKERCPRRANRSDLTPAQC